ncbi:hypothetical protein DOTSEDRAFT_73216 [Dothistroma septosporum NZE10]|uniref:Uncharacterized protein n=1 Tax=Dothistroma septosporum (strain NZE10 / CBS 128990) TaxID=675120 RepID=N1PI79_DOTSN|nr:hypothetical protein DOTSEDRAFT_73216 [Dothistroma septosporum NZE10]
MHLSPGLGILMRWCDPVADSRVRTLAIVFSRCGVWSERVERRWELGHGRNSKEPAGGLRRVWERRSA